MYLTEPGIEVKHTVTPIYIFIVYFAVVLLLALDAVPWKGCRLSCLFQ